jgi:dethiobiotin synthetase
MTSNLAILGTEFGCGKTVLMSGLVGLLREQGFTAQAIKPIFIGALAERDSEKAFIDAICRPTTNTASLMIERGRLLSEGEWHKAVAIAHSGVGLTLVELPGGCATPLSMTERDPNSSWRDPTDLVQLIDAPCLLVAKHALDALEKLKLSAFFIKSRKLNILGLVTVETVSSGGQELEHCLSKEEVQLSLNLATGIPYLGCIKHSQSISVRNGSQGNLIKMTAGGIELLNLLKSLNLNVPTKD